jgi:hypothetical protein
VIDTANSFSLKRKRSMYEDLNDGDDDEHNMTDEADQLEFAPPAKRSKTKRIVSAVAQTVAAVTLGAAVTWTGLAFW